ncbi:MAG: arginine deiminase family protein [Thermoanaerobaculales bacterium]|jgi:arginine deiminase|nr:arginine deiminase family protein [Thermoanaerobaculales bacterium]
MVHVTSEIGRLRRVLVHEPGAEIDRMVPPMMEELLFDDILFGERARDEHGRFRRLLQVLGVEVVEVADLLAETLASPKARSWLWRMLLPQLPPGLRDAPPADGDEMLEVVVGGLLTGATDGGIEVGDLFRLPPLPNWCFQRDPQVIVGPGVVFSAMATPARWREGILARAIFRFHPELAATPVLHDPMRPEPGMEHVFGLHRPRLEGGDVLVLSPEIVAVGVSERTNSHAVDALARALARSERGPRWLEVVQLPRRRAYMHLDTVFTPADRDAALVFAPVVWGDGPQAADAYEIDLHADDLGPRHRGRLGDALAERGLGLEPIPCGGADPIDQLREQWTDGANTLALAPGIITLYDRNVATASELDRRGWRVVAAEDVLLGRAEVSLDDDGRTCLLLPSHEISRARGGPHCLSHPLERDEI